MNRNSILARDILCCLACAMLCLAGCGAPTTTSQPTSIEIPPTPIQVTAMPTSPPSPVPPTLIPALLSGRVVSAIDDQPIPAALVEALDVSQRWISVVNSVTDALGEYRFEELPDGEYYLIASAEGYARQFYQQGAVLQEAKKISCCEQPLAGLDFTLSQGGTITGKVTQADGATPVQGVTVQAGPARFAWVDMLSQKAMTDDQGDYRITNLALGEYLVFVEDDGWANEFYPEGNYVSQFQPVLVQPPSEVTGIDLHLDVEGRLSGVVIDEQSEKPVPEATVQMVPLKYEDLYTWGLIAETNYKGEFFLRRLPSNDFVLSVRAEGFADEIYDHRPGWKQADMIPIQSGQHVEGVMVRMRPYGSIQGHLFDETGKPLEGFLLNVNLPNDDHASALPLHTQSDGGFSGRMPPGTYVLFTEFVPGFVQEYYDDVRTLDVATHIEVTVGSQTLDLVINLKLAGQICGSVLQSDGLSPVEKAQIYALPVGGTLASGSRIGAQTITKPDGSYCLEGLPSGSYQVQAAAPGGMVVYYPGVANEGEAKIVEVQAPEKTEGIVIVLLP